MKLTSMGRKLFVLAAGIALAALPGVSANATTQATGTQIYSGNGWKIDNASGLYSLSGDGTGYTLQFADAEAKTKLGEDAKQVAAQLASVTGIKFTVSTTLKASPENCADQPRHVLTLAVKYRPLDGKVGYSRALQCYNSGDHSVWGGWAFMDSEYWTTANWFSTNKTTNASMIKNAITHEVGHMVGFDHPNTDLNGDGTAADYECALTPKGYRPVMCSPNGGYLVAADGGNFTSLETPGLKQLAANWSLAVPAAEAKSDLVAPRNDTGRGVSAGSAF